MPHQLHHKSTADDVAEFFAAEIRGKVVLITGVSRGGLGHDTARAVASKDPQLVILAGRNRSKCVLEESRTRVEANAAKLRLLEVDLASSQSVRKAAEEVLAYSENLDVLIQNAAVMALPKWTESEYSGIEKQFAVNHLNPFLFTNLLKPKLTSSKARVVFLGSTGHLFSDIRPNDPGFSGGKEYTGWGWEAYGQSKTANMLSAIAFSKHWEKDGIQAFSCHPGFISTNLQQETGFLSTLYSLYGHVRAGLMTINFKSTNQGAATTLVAAFDPELSTQPGAYLSDCQVTPDKAKPYAHDPENAEVLWRLSEKILGQSFQ